MRAFAGLFVLVALLAACGAPFADGAPPVPTGTPVAASAINANATATRGTASVTRSGTAARAATSAVATPIPAAIPTLTPTPAPTIAAPTPTFTPVPVRPGPPIVTPGIVATPGTPGSASPIAGTPGTPRAGTPRIGTPGTPGMPTTATNDPNRTTTQIFAPYRPDGLVQSLRVTGTVSGYCVGGAQTLPGRPDAWRCATGGRFLDPCFASATPDTQPLACAAAPWSDEITLLNLTAPLPRERANGTFSVAAAPWGLQLANGVRCQAHPGGNATVAGMQITAACSDGSQLLGDPDRSGGRWRVFVMRDNGVSLESQEVSAVWY